MDTQASGWDQMGDFTGGGNDDQSQPSNVPFYLAPANQAKIQKVAAAKGVAPDQMVNSVKASIAAGKSTPEQAQAELDTHAQTLDQPQGSPLAMPQVASRSPQGLTPEQISQARPPGQDWLAPLVALADSQTGSKLSAGYQAPTSTADLLKYQDSLSKSQNDLLGRDAKSQVSQNARDLANKAIAQYAPQLKGAITDDMTAEQLKGENGLINKIIASGASAQKTATGNDYKQQRLDNMKDNQARTAISGDKILNTLLPRVEGATKINELIGAARQSIANPNPTPDQVVANKSLLAQLNAEVARLETGTQSPGLNAAEKTELTSKYADLKNMMDSFTSKPTNSLSPQLLDAIQASVNELNGSYQKAVDTRFKTLKAGFHPEQQDIIDQRHQAIKDDYQQRLGSTWGQGKSTQPAQAQGSGGAAAPDARVTVKNAQGQIGHIPQSQLADALKAGYQEVK